MLTDAPRAVSALYLEPCGRRRLVTAVITRCGSCGGAHTHRLADSETGPVVRRCPTTRAAYLLAVDRG